MTALKETEQVEYTRGYTDGYQEGHHKGLKIAKQEEQDAYNRGFEAGQISGKQIFGSSTH